MGINPSLIMLHPPGSEGKQNKVGDTDFNYFLIWSHSHMNNGGILKQVKPIMKFLYGSEGNKFEPLHDNGN